MSSVLSTGRTHYFEQLERRSVPTTGLISGLLGTLGTVAAGVNATSGEMITAQVAGTQAAVGAATNTQLAANVAGINASAGANVGAGVTAGTSGLGIAINTNITANAAVNLPFVQSTLNTATGLIDQVLSEVTSLLPAGLSI